MPVTQSVATEITASCDNPSCRRGQNGPTVVKWNLESIQQGKAKIPEESTRFVSIVTFDNKILTACCAACAAEILGFPQPDLTGPPRSDNVIPFCRQPMDAALKERPVNGLEGK